MRLGLKRGETLRFGRNMNYRNGAFERYCIVEKPGRRPYFVYQRKGLEPFVWNIWEFPEPVADNVPTEEDFIRQSRSGVKDIVGINNDDGYIVVRIGNLLVRPTHI